MILTPSELLQKTNKKIEQQQKHVAGDGLIIEMQSDGLPAGGAERAVTSGFHGNGCNLSSSAHHELYFIR